MQNMDNREMKLLAKLHFQEKVLEYYTAMKDKALGELFQMGEGHEDYKFTQAIIAVLNEEMQKTKDTITYLRNLRSEYGGR